MLNCNCKKLAAAGKKAAGKKAIARPCIHVCPVCKREKVSIYTVANGAAYKVASVAPHGKFVAATRNNDGSWHYHKAITPAQFAMKIRKAG